MDHLDNTPIDPILADLFHRFFDGTPVSAVIIDTSRGDADFRHTVIVTDKEGAKHVLKLADNDFTFPEKMRMWQRTVEEYRKLGYDCPPIFCDRDGGFPAVEYQGHTCYVHAEAFAGYRPLSERTAADEDQMREAYNGYLEDIWRMTARIAAKKLDYTDYPSAYCLFETFCPSDKTDEVLENALAWKALADALPESFTAQVQRIWTLWSGNRESLAPLYRKLPTSVFQADLNATNLLIDEDGTMKGVYDFNLSGKEVFLNYLMRENDSETIPQALEIASRYYAFSEEEKAAALPLYRCLKPLWWNAAQDLRDAGTDADAIRRCLDRAERLLTEDLDFRSHMNGPTAETARGKIAESAC